MDISAKNKTASDIFSHMLDVGPQTLYSISRSSSFPLGTIHRHFVELEKQRKIKIYQKTDSGRRKKTYGPTFYGIVYFARINPSIRKKLENYFLLWIDHDEFLKVLQEEGFDVEKITNNTKHLFKKYVEYGIAIEDQIENLKNDFGSIPHEIFVFIGEILLSSDPKYMSDWKYLYKNLPGLQKAINSNIQNMIKIQKRLSKN